jgi:exodeoxyribonuclease VII large subunit
MLQEKLAQVGVFHMERRRGGWARAADRLSALSPLAVLDRGYALVYSETSTKLVKSSDRLKAGDGLQIRFAHGRARAQVIEAEKEP